MPLFRGEFAALRALPPAGRLRHCTVAALRFPRPFRRANRAASSKTACCFRHRRRFTVFRSAQSVFCQKVNCPAAGKRSPSGGRTCRGGKPIWIYFVPCAAPGQPLAALLPYGCCVPLAG